MGEGRRTRLTETPRWVAVATEAARLRVDEISLRGVAREIGMSATGLRGILDGAEPYGRTLEKLRAWFARVRGLGDVPAEEAQNTVIALLRRLPEPHAGAVALLDCLEELHVNAGVEVPGWVPDVRERLAMKAAWLNR